MDGRAPDPQEAAILTETIDEMLAALPPELRQIALWKLDGLTNEEIAQRLGLNTRTIKHYLTGVFRKMRVRNRVEAVVRAKALGVTN